MLLSSGVKQEWYKIGMSWGMSRQVLRLTQKVRREYEPLDRGKYN